MNPYYDAEKLGLKIMSFDEPGLNNEFNTLCFWITENKEIYSAFDSGCSSPNPFKEYEGETLKEIFLKLERINPEKVVEYFDHWNKNYDGTPLIPGASVKRGLRRWITDHTN